MTKYFLFFSLCLASLNLFSLSHDPYELAAFAGEPSSIVDGCVSAITGDYLISQNLLTVRGHEPIQFDCNYFSHRGTEKLGGWGFLCNHLVAHLIAYRSPMEVKYVLEIPEKIGISLTYMANYGKKTKQQLPFMLINFPGALTNCFSGEIGARLNLLNNEVWRDLNDKKQFLVKSADGSTRCYRVHGHRPFDKPTKIKEGPVIDRVPLFLCWETLPNGNIIRYDFQTIDEQEYLCSVKAVSPDQKTLYSWAHLFYSFRKKNRLVQVTIRTSDSQELVLNIDPEQKIGKQKFWLPRQSLHPTQPDEVYDYGGWDKEGCFLNKHLYPDGRGKHIDYYHQGQNHPPRGVFEVQGLDHPLYKKVQKLSAPVKEDQTFHLSKHFYYQVGEYEKRGGITDVFDSENKVTRYHYNERFLLTRIERFNSDHTLFFTELFHWHSPHSSTPNYLYGKTLLEGSGKAAFSILNDYDSVGNVIKQSFCGHLSGQSKGNGLVMNAEGFPDIKEAETCSIHREFYPNNLIFKEHFFNGKSVEYYYVPNTDLLSCKLIYDGPQIKLREFFFYKESIKIQEIVDDGTEKDCFNLNGVSTRLIKTFDPISGGAFIGFPKEVREEFLDLKTGALYLDKKTIFHYNSRGLVEKSDHFDTQNTHRYSLTYTYDGKGRLIKETDALGREKEVRYDTNNNIVYEKRVDDPFAIENIFDYSNRLTASTMTAENGKHLSIHNRYNTLHQKVEEIDAQNQSTSYAYTPLGYPKTISLPPIKRERPIIKNTFNAIGKVGSTTDPLGRVTRTFYTSRGHPMQVIYPDLSKERFQYSLDGKLILHTSPGKTQTHYTYDFLDRIIEKRILSSDGKEIKESFIYNAFNLIEKIDPDGVKTTFSYDGLNRLIKTEILDTVIEKSYDPLGRVFKIVEGSKVLQKKYDLLDRILEEREEDLFGNVYGFTFYEYDACGKKIAEKREVFGTEAICRFEYDSFGRLFKTSTPLGEETTTSYEDHAQNGLGQTVRQKKTKHPIGREEVITCNPSGKVDSIALFCPIGAPLLREEFTYDLAGQKTAQTSHLFNPDKTIFKRWEYDSRGRVSLLTEGEEPNLKATHFSYTEEGHLKTKKKPSGVELHFTYDAFGRKTSICSSDHSVHYELAYDVMGYLTSSFDAIHDAWTRRNTDHFGNCLEETLSSGLTVKRTYDSLGRKTSLSLPNGVEIDYTYDPYHLQAICRKDENNTSLYTHSYLTYDMSHNLTEEALPYDFGTISYTIDLNGRRIASKSPYSHEEIVQLDASGNVLESVRHSFRGEENAFFSYDALDQLTEEKSPYFTHSYCYDAHLNRTQKDGSGSLLNSCHELLSTETSLFTNDANGNRTSKTSSEESYQCHYDALDRLTVIETPFEKRCFFYDFFNRYTSQQFFKKVEEDDYYDREECYMYDEQKELGTTTHFKILGEQIGAEIGAAIAIEESSTNEIFFPMHDLFGNIIALQNTQGEHVQERRFSPFGETVLFKTPPNKEATIPWGFHSKRHLAHFIHFGRRLYDPATGRWLTCDPKGFDEGPNLYQFLKNAPLLHHDLYGEEIKRLKNVDDLISNASVDRDFEKQQNGPYSRNWTYSPEKNYTLHKNHPLLTGEKQINFIGGINNTFEEHKNNVRLLSRYAQDMPIHSTYNATHGFKNDLREAKMGLNLTVTSPALLLAQMKRDFFASAPPNAICLDILHSQGAIHGLLSQLFLPPSERRRVVQLCIAPAAFQPKNISKNAFHYLSTKDRVPQLQQIWGRLPRTAEHITVLTPEKGEGTGHSFSSSIYEQPITEGIKDYINGVFDETP